MHNTPDCKFGKCFMCDREANNYDKLHFVPLCGMECKNKLKRINAECIMNDHFSMLGWLMEALLQPNSNDEVITNILLKELPEVELSLKDIGMLLQILVDKVNVGPAGAINPVPGNSTGVMGNRLAENSVMIFTHLMRKYTGEMMTIRQEWILHSDKNDPTSTRLLPCFEASKIFLYEVIRALEALPILNSTLQLTYLNCLTSCLSITNHGISVIREFYLRCDCTLL